MNWISVLSQVFFAVFITSATGTVMFFIWFLCRMLLQKHNPKLVYYMLRWVVIMFLLPITYVAFAMNYDAGYIKPMMGIWKMLFVVDSHNLLFQGVAMVWVVLATVMFGSLVKNEVSRRRICKSNFEDGVSLAQTEFERIKEALGVKGRVELLRNDDRSVLSPFVTGFFKRKVVVPYLDYTQDELKVILYHELNHIKKSDVIFRYLAMIAIIINCLNPAVYLLWERVLLWSEADCDARALDGLETEGIKKRRYYDIIWKLLEAGPEEPTLFYNPMLMSAEESLYRRIKIMEKYRTNVKRVGKSMTFALVMIFAMVSSVTAHAAGVGMAEAGDKALVQTQSIESEGGFTEFEAWSEEMEIPASDAVDIVYINDGIMTLGSGTIDWEVPAGTRCVTASIYLTKGTEVQIACTAKPSTCLYWFGLMNADSSCTIVEGTGSGSHTFTVSSTGYYRIMVENRSIQSINVTGGYSY